MQQMQKKANQWAWLTLDKLPDLGFMVDDMRQDSEEMLTVLTRLKAKPWVLEDEAILHRATKLFTDRLEMLKDHSSQIARLQKEALTAPQIQELDRLESATRETKRLTHTILALAHEIVANTVDE